ncbi:MAG: phosphate signaling complex protein PhoU [Candidatus Bathyarchaeia archaeon]|jgi:phosphate transport system protein
MSRLLDTGLEQLTTIVFRMGEVAQRAINIAVDGFLEGDDVGEEVHELSELLVAMTVTAEDKAFELIVKYQPVASDLRIINSYMKIAYDMERYGRYAWDISFTHKKLADCSECVQSGELMDKITKKTLEMVDTSTKALRDNDADMAKTLAKTENEVDEIYSAYLDLLSKAPPKTKCLVCNFLVVRYLERIADHATYIGESIVYISTGEKVSLR